MCKGNSGYAFRSQSGEVGQTASVISGVIVALRFKGLCVCDFSVSASWSSLWEMSNWRPSFDRMMHDLGVTSDTPMSCMAMSATAENRSGCLVHTERKMLDWAMCNVLSHQEMGRGR